MWLLGSRGGSCILVSLWAAQVTGATESRGACAGRGALSRARPQGGEGPTFLASSSSCMDRMYVRLCTRTCSSSAVVCRPSRSSCKCCQGAGRRAPVCTLPSWGRSSQVLGHPPAQMCPAPSPAWSLEVSFALTPMPGRESQGELVPPHISLASQPRSPEPPSLLGSC